ncbi:MAG: UvrD-helicase domain-containing protein, partial [Candidatus Binataceae bacterium]
VLEDLRSLTALFPKAQKHIIKTAVQAIREIIDKDDGRIGLRGSLIEEYGAIRAAPLMIATAELIARIASALTRRMSMEGLVTFDGLVSGAIRLLKRDDIAVRYRSELGALLVDEYQDVDRTQDRIIRLLTEPRAGVPSPALFIVGDEKQSIYGFRGADVTMFNAAREPEPAVLRLKQNRRSTPALLDFFNRLGAGLMSADADARPFRVAWNAEHDLEPVRRQGAGPAVEIFLAPVSGKGEKRPSIELRADEAQALAHWIDSAVRSGMAVADKAGEETPRPASYRDFAILMRSFTDIQSYERALEATAIPFHTVRGRGFFACPEIIDAVSLLAAIDEPDDGISLVAALRSPLFGLSDQILLELALLAERTGKPIARLFAGKFPEFDEAFAERKLILRAWKIIGELRAMRANLSIAELIERALMLTGFEAVMLAQADGRQRVSNIRKLVALARRYEERKVFELDDFIAALRRLIDEAPLEPEAQILSEDEDVVRLMTIHQAKGLEFPIVILADMGRRPPNSPLHYAISEKDGLLLCDTLGSGYDELPNRFLLDFKKALKERETAESARLLYVAATRARDRLVLSEGAGKSEWTEELRQLIGTEQIERFLAGGGDEQAVQAGDASVILRRSETGKHPPRPQTNLLPNFADMAEFAALARERINFTAPVNNEMVTSPTALADFNRCPRQYLLRHRLRIPERPASGQPVGNAAEMGIAAHAVLEQLGEAGANTSAAGIKAAVEKYAKDLSLDERARGELTDDLFRYISADLNGRVAGREIPFFLKIEDESSKLFLRGRIDLLLEREGALVIRDFKYSRPGKSDGESWRIQMESYALAAAAAYPDHEVRAELVFLRGGSHSAVIELPEQLHSRQRLLHIARAIIDARTTGEYPIKPLSAHACRELGCGYIARCWREGAAARG